MQSMPITTEDQELIQAAKDVLTKYYKPHKHGVGSAIRMKSGRIYSAVHLEANVGRVAVCAEAIAFGKAVSGGESTPDTVVAVHYMGEDPSQGMELLSPCGMCRELLTDYSKDVKAIYPDENGNPAKAGMSDLLPFKSK
jgi:cytidine deaminase